MNPCRIYTHNHTTPLATKPPTTTQCLGTEQTRTNAVIDVQYGYALTLRTERAQLRAQIRQKAQNYFGCFGHAGIQNVRGVGVKSTGTQTSIKSMHPISLHHKTDTRVGGWHNL